MSELRALSLGLLISFLASTTMASGDAQAQTQSSPVGAAIALSVEPAAIGYCRDRNREEAVACAMKACEADGGQSCQPVTWCHVAGAGGVMFGYNTNVGMSALFGACGGFSREGIETILKARCSGDAKHADCAMVKFWDVDGAEIDVKPE